MWRECANRFNRWRYDLYAPVYDKVAQGFARHRRRSIGLLNPQPDERLLLVGAGTGLDLDFLVRCRHVAAIDIAPAMLARLRERAAKLGMEVDARVMDGQKLDFPDASFDAVALHLTLAVVPDPRACLLEVERVLKPGGRVVVFDKFLADGGRAPLWRRAGNLLARAVATDINRRLGDIVSVTKLQPFHDEDAGFGGFLRIVLLRK
ncbi:MULTISPECIES: class I SAM-dependent methyltransferase [Chromobacteriaceae]|uniref:Phosphatidylethanolamine N-methyltransferase n=1 Tax=Pseudogulbenkiania ferrooxidans EGD-HP2 TaxID=1388764 RepID=A0ABN0N0W1_9NEIS|nr:MULTISPECIES: methyltransferase domain-containing protein [Chromobacteriaceae]AVG15528.1 SAM-dependent methyltransferase [Chromobacterium vaccinii]ERD99114.1 phosphatidylethanolamine N-methyltransferase [Pseudogulbenkiania ferrooxidans EGD-HP2]